MNFLEEKIKSTQGLQKEQEHESNKILNDENKENSLSDKAKYFHLLAEIETFANKTEQDSQVLGKLLEKTSELLLNAENLNKDEIDTLEEIKESLQEYFIHLKQNENERQFSNISPNFSVINNDLLKESITKESQSNEVTQNVSDESQKDLPPNDIRFDESARMLMVGDNVYCMGLDGVVRKIINYGSEKQFSEKNQKLNPKNLNLEDMYKEYLEGIGINVDEIFKINEKSQDSNPQHTIKTSLFDDEEVKPQKKRMS